MKTAFLTMIAAMTAGTMTAAEFKIPFEKNTDILNEKGEKCAEGFVKGKLKFVPGANGSGLELRRSDNAYPGLVKFTIPEMSWRNGTIAFRLKPDWELNDRNEAWIMNCRSKNGFLFYILKRKDKCVELSVVAPKQTQMILRKEFKKDAWTHVAVTWNSEKGSVTVYLNGKKAGEAVNPVNLNVPEETAEAFLFPGDASMFLKKGSAGDGVYDDILISDKTLSAEEIMKLAATAN